MEQTSRNGGQPRRRLAVIGGGLVGTATACAAAQRGGDQVQVDLFEAATIGHLGGASIDVQRAFRHAHADEAHYTRWTIEALRRWRELELQSERELFVQTGVLWMLHADDQPFVRSGMERPMFGSGLFYIEESYRTMRSLGVAAELLDGPELRRRYPDFPDPTIVRALHDSESGMLRARDAVLALSDVGVRHGVNVHEGKRAVEVVPSAGSCAVRFADGSSVEADAVVLAVNGWVSTLLPELNDRIGPPRHPQSSWLAPGLQNTEQPVFHIVPRPESAAQFDPRRFPMSSFLNTRIHLFPLMEGAVKLANDDGTRPIGAPEERRYSTDAYREELFAYAERQIPALRGAALVQERVCFYDRSPDDDFILDQWDPNARLLVACGFSGHGFKFGPLLGDRLARYALSGQRPDDLPRFSLERFRRESSTTA